MYLLPSLSPGRTLIFDGEQLYTELLEDLALMDDHCYDLCEIFKFFTEWKNNRDIADRWDVIREYAGALFSTSVIEESVDYNTLVEAMQLLYQSMDALLQRQSVRVVHAAYYEETGELLITLED